MSLGASSSPTPFRRRTQGIRDTDHEGRRGRSNPKEVKQSTSHGVARYGVAALPVNAAVWLSGHRNRKHHSAANNFMRELSWLDRVRFLCAWRKLAYHKADKDGKHQFYAQYADCDSLTLRRKMRPIAIQRIERIIALARR